MFLSLVLFALLLRFFAVWFYLSAFFHFTYGALLFVLNLYHTETKTLCLVHTHTGHTFFIINQFNLTHYPQPTIRVYAFQCDNNNNNNNRTRHTFALHCTALIARLRVSRTQTHVTRHCFLHTDARCAICMRASVFHCQYHTAFIQWMEFFSIIKSIVCGAHFSIHYIKHFMSVCKLQFRYSLKSSQRFFFSLSVISRTIRRRSIPLFFRLIHTTCALSFAI